MRALAVLTLSLAAALGSGCIFQNISSEEKLQDAVVEVNDQLRWGRIELALTRVAPEHREEFVRRHRAWGRSVYIADVELINLQRDGRQRGTSFIAFRWYSLDTMIVRETILRQEWERQSAGYVVVAEAVADGDPALLPEAAPEDEDEGGEDAADATGIEATHEAAPADGRVARAGG